MKRYEIRDKKQFRGWIARNPYDKYTFTYRVYGSEDGNFDYVGYPSLEEVELAGWIVPKKIKIKLMAPTVLVRTGICVGLLALVASCLASLGGIFILFTCAWDFHTGQDTGYISAVDKMSFSDDRTIYLRRRPLDAQGYTTAEEDESKYCTTAAYPEVIERAYEAMANGKRVILIYDTPRPFGWRALGHCNSAPVTEIKYAE